MINGTGIPKGTVQLCGKELDQRFKMMDILKGVYKQFGYDPLTTPTLEYADVFDGHHGEGEKLLFNLKDSSQKELVLRYDLTVPLARYIAQNPDAPIPFKRYQVDNVFRDDEVDKGHFREFVQCDGDVVGVKSLIADAEVITLACAGLEQLGFDDFVIKINHRLIINGLAKLINVDKLNVYRALDAIGKFLETNHRTTYPNPVLFFQSDIEKIMQKYGFDKDACEKSFSVLSIEGGTLDEQFKLMENVFQEEPVAVNGISDLREIISYLDSVTISNIKFDILLARGADYYTGFILEGTVDDAVGSVLGGGRFDKLIQDLGGPDLPAVGMAFGLERLFVAATTLGILDTEISDRTIVVATKQADITALNSVVSELRGNGSMVDFMPMFDCTEEEIISYAKKRGFLHLVILNGDTPNMLAI